VGGWPSCTDAVSVALEAEFSTVQVTSAEQAPVNVTRYPGADAASRANAYCGQPSAGRPSALACESVWLQVPPPAEHENTTASVATLRPTMVPFDGGTTVSVEW
jgi:hypothetical protein